MSTGIYLIQDNGELVEMREQAYDSEALLQELLAKYPSLLAGDQVDSTAPRRWLLVTREMGVPCEEAGGDRWSVDHLFLDQDAVPTIIEVKRSSDTRIRREVVGQMLDYAANAVVYWPVEQIRARFESNCQQTGSDPDQRLADFLGDAGTDSDFWQQVKTNLQAGRVRLVFIADEIPSELRRVVEFLNAQMDPAEVLAVEIKQYLGGTLKTLVPRVIGATAEAQQRKGASPRETRQWDEASFFADLQSRKSGEDVRVARAIFDWAKRRQLRIWWGKGKEDGSFFPVFNHGVTKHFSVSVWTYGRVEVQFELMKTRPQFAEESKRRELLARLNAIPGVTLPDDAITRRPSIQLATLARQEVLDQFLGVLDWIVDSVRQGPAA